MRKLTLIVLGVLLLVVLVQCKHHKDGHDGKKNDKDNDKDNGKKNDDDNGKDNGKKNDNGNGKDDDKKKDNDNGKDDDKKKDNDNSKDDDKKKDNDNGKDDDKKKDNDNGKDNDEKKGNDNGKDNGKKNDNDDAIDDGEQNDEDNAIDNDDEQNAAPVDEEPVEEPKNFCKTKCVSSCKFGTGADSSFDCPTKGKSTGKKNSKVCCVPVHHPCSAVGGICMKRECAAHYTSVSKGKDICGGNTYHCCAPDTTQYAKCIMQPASDKFDDQVEGTIYFKQATGKDLEYLVNLRGFDTSDENKFHGFHVHTLGDISGGCTSATGHFNPDLFDHAHPDALTRHIGGLDNIEEDNKGRARAIVSDSKAALSGEYSILGRSIVVHQGSDDFVIGNAGPRIACCTIGIASKELYEAEREFLKDEGL